MLRRAETYEYGGESSGRYDHVPFLPTKEKSGWENADFEARSAYLQSCRICSAYKEEKKLTDQILRSLRDCTGFHPDLKAYIFREILAACAACDDLTSFRQITERYGNRFGIVRSIPFKKSLTEISRDSGKDISREAGGYHSSLDLSDRRDRDPFITRKKEYLDLLDIGKLDVIRSMSAGVECSLLK